MEGDFLDCQNFPVAMSRLHDGGRQPSIKAMWCRIITLDSTKIGVSKALKCLTNSETQKCCHAFHHFPMERLSCCEQFMESVDLKKTKQSDGNSSASKLLDLEHC